MATAFSPARAGFDARLGLENAAGGVNGRQIRYQWRDDKGEPATNLAMSQDLVDREGVFAVMEASIVSSGGAQYLADKGVPVLGIAVEQAWSEHRNMFAFNYPFTGGGFVTTFGDYIRDQGGTRAITIRDPAAGATSGEFADQFAASIRSTDVELDDSSIIDYTPGVTSPERLARQMLTDGTDTLVSALSTTDFVDVVAAARAAGVPLKVILSGSAVDAELLAQYGSTLAGLTFFSTTTPFVVESPALDRYRSAISRYAPQLADPDQTIALVSYITADMLIRGLQEVGPCLTRERFIDGLRAVDGYDAGGLVTSTDFDENFGRPALCSAFVRVNATGNGFDVVDPNYCGTRLPE